MKKVYILKVWAILACLFINFFFINLTASASSFAYSDFNWDEFLQKNKNYWTESCDENDFECVDKYIKNAEKFYKRLYSLLATYERKGYRINDNIIIETVFYGLTPESFRDQGTIESIYEGQDENYAYSIDEGANSSKYIATDDDDIEGAKEYFEKETDSLKTLMNAMIGYQQACYGISSNAPYKDSSGNLVCNDNFEVLDNQCVVKVEVLNANFFDKIGLSIFSSNNNSKKCQELTSSYPSYKLGEVIDKGVNEELYWNFLENERYFDNKFQLQSYFNLVLSSTNHEKMSDLTEEEYQKYQDDIVNSRKKIISNIREILDSYGDFAETPQSSFTNYTSSDSYWWPIGGSEITKNGNSEMAIGDPVSLTVSSQFGRRTHPISGETNSMHYGLDISAPEGVANVIASKSGVVVYPTNNKGSCVKGDKSCGGGYGNYVVILHNDGTYTLYAHMYTDSIRVSAGQNVLQGQVIGTVGSTGNSTGGHLHFEVRVGGNSKEAAQNPLNYISTENPRPSFNSSSLINFIHSWEGTPPSSGDNYLVFDDGYGNLTVGWGVVPKYHEQQFQTVMGNSFKASSLSVGTPISKTVVDNVENMIISNYSSSVKSMLSAAGITLEPYQIDALISRMYNYSVSGFVEAYKTYGNTQALYDNYMSKPITSNGKTSNGLIRRRKAEWDLFYTGNYKGNN